MKIINYISVIILGVEVVWAVLPHRLAASENNEIVIRDHDWIWELNHAKTEKEKNKLLKDFRLECPFRSKSSPLSDLTQGAIALSLSEKMTGKSREQCQGLIDGFNESMKQTQSIKNQADSLELDDEGMNEVVQLQLDKAIATTASLRSLARTQCEFQEDNGPSNIAKVGHHVSNVLDTTSTMMMLINPFIALGGVAVSAGTRLITSLSQWLFGKGENEMAHEAEKAENYIADLCSFRNLAFRFDELIGDPLSGEHPHDAVIKANEEYKKRKKIRLAERKKLEKQLACLSRVDVKITTFDDLNVEVERILNASLAQEKSPLHQCLNLLTKFKDRKGDLYLSLSSLANEFKCASDGDVQNEIKSENENEIQFCRNFDTIKKNANEDYFNLCESKKYQSSVIGSFTKISVILLNESTVAKRDVIGPIRDKISQLKADGNKDKKKLEEFKVVRALMDTNPISNTSTQKALSNLGRHVLGYRFDAFAKNAIENSEEGLKNSRKVLNEINELVEEFKTGKTGFFGTELSEEEKVIKKNKLCDRASQVKRNIGNILNYSAGVRDVCTFMSGNGLPSLLNKDLNFDIYSADISEQENSIGSRCEKIKIKISAQLEEINSQYNAVANAQRLCH